MQLVDDLLDEFGDDDDVSIGPSGTVLCNHIFLKRKRLRGVSIGPSGTVLCNGDKITAENALMNTVSIGPSGTVLCNEQVVAP